ncbi:MAG TPA: LysR family transcriptional regulator [Candidatus Binatia bacterium]|jgi:DNA-binding transcriptional LysR family regulator
MFDAALLPALHDALTVARHGSVARAAEALFKTPSAVSQQLRRIEQHFGVSLFERDGRGIRLTASGEAFLGPATRLFDEAESVCDLLDSMAGAPVATVRIAASDYLGKELLAPVLRDIQLGTPAVGGSASRASAPDQRSLAPALRVAITTAHSSEAVRLLELGQVDAAIVSTASTLPGLDEHLLFEQPLQWIAARRDPPMPVMERLATEPVLRLAAGSLGRSVLDAWLERHAIQPASTIDVPGVSLLIDYATTGCGIGLAPALPLRELDSRRLFIEDAGLPPLPVRLVMRPSFPVAPPMAMLLERVKARGLALAKLLAADRRGGGRKGRKAALFPAERG